mmetsp:Transcript_109231/g.340407  ORF Transcript_109231/g.340407 Transcript_109231/m.340407 type:complete len:207 (+) Transcript_109231:963-1583(+)
MALAPLHGALRRGLHLGPAGVQRRVAVRGRLRDAGMVLLDLQRGAVLKGGGRRGDAQGLPQRRALPPGHPRLRLPGLAAGSRPPEHPRLCRAAELAEQQAGEVRQTRLRLLHRPLHQEAGVPQPQRLHGRGPQRPALPAGRRARPACALGRRHGRPIHARRRVADRIGRCWRDHCNLRGHDTPPVHLVPALQRPRQPLPRGKPHPR